MNQAISLLEALPDEARGDSVARLIRLGAYQDKIGWAYGDFLAGIAARFQRRK